MKRRQQPDERTVTAWHEAGHAVVGMATTGNVASATIEATGDALGWVDRERLEWWTAEQLAARRHELSPGRFLLGALAAARFAIAGNAAEGILQRRTVETWSPPDHRSALEFCGLIYPDATRIVFERECTATRRWLLQHRAHLSAIAAALLTHGTVDRDGLHCAIEALPFPVMIGSLRAAARFYR